ASVDELLEACGSESFDAVVVAYTPFHRPPHRDDVLGELLVRLRARSPNAKLVLADCYQSGQHYVECEGRAVLDSYPELDHWVKYESGVSVPDVLDGRVGTAVVLGARP